MAELVAAVRATEQMDREQVIEKAHRPNEAMAISHSSLHTYGSLAEVHEEVTPGKPDLQRLVVEEFDVALEWLSDNGVELKDWMRASSQSGTAKLIEQVRSPIRWSTSWRTEAGDSCSIRP